MNANLPFTCGKDCPNRYPGCHGKCEKYLAEKAAWDKRKAEVQARNVAAGYSSDQVRKRKDQAARKRREVPGVRRTHF